jgi:TolB-like protein
MRTLARLVVLVACAGAARADSPRLAVVALDAPPELTFTGKNVAQAVAAEARRSGAFEVVGPDAVEQRLGRTATAAFVSCGGDAPCLARAGARLGVDRVVAGWLRKAGDRYEVHLVLVDVATGERLGVLAREVPVASRTLRQVVLAAAPALLAGRADARGVLKVLSEVAEARVAIDDEPAGTTPLTRSVLPGRHKVQVTKDGFALGDPVWIDVPAGHTVEHRPRLFELPARERGAGASPTAVEIVR